MARIDESRPFIPVRIAVLTVSDTRTPKDDKSGALLASMPSRRMTSKLCASACRAGSMTPASMR
jgi:molybdopterin biosynthesis enzyme MoaB